MSLPLSITLIVATFKRPESMMRCLDSILAQTRPPQEVFMIDDAEMDPEPFVAKAKAAGLNLIYHRKNGNRGLTPSRNYGIDHASSDILCFLDDDVELEPTYIEELMKVYEADSSHAIGGAQGVDIHYEINHLKMLFLEIFSLGNYHFKRGRILWNGQGGSVFGVEQDQQADWLSGCNMSFRKEIFEGRRFDENFYGNGLLDDRDFSIPVGREKKLMTVAKARLRHHEDPKGRTGHRRFGFMQVTFAFRLLCRRMNPTPLHRVAFLWTALGMALMNFLSSYYRERAAGNLKGMVWVARSLFVADPPIPGPEDK